MPKHSSSSRPPASRQPLSRRAFLVATAGTLAAACSREKASPVTRAPSPTPRPRTGGPGPLGPVVQGGVIRTRLRNDYVNLDPHATAQASAQWVGMLALSRLLRFAIGPGEDNLAPRIAPEMVKGIPEITEDGRVIVTLREDIHFQDTPPVYGRRITSTDVRVSFQRALKGKTGASLATIAAIETPDSQTVIFRLKRPSVTFLTTLASAHGLFVMPYEVDASYDPARQPIGAGPWMLERLEPAVQVRWKSNPRYALAGAFRGELPYAEALVEKVIPEDATATSQFLAGELDLLEVASNELIAVQDSLPDAQIVAFPQQGFSFMGFSGRPGQPFRDLRVRQAFSTALDRRALANVSYDTDKLEEAGFPVLREQPAAPLPARFRYWVDPTTQPWGYHYDHRPLEARRLLEAAGWDFGRTINLHFTNNRYGRAYSDSVEAVIQLLGRIGVRVQPVGHDYASAWVDVWQKGDFDGIGYFLVARFAEPHDYFARIVHSKGQFNPGRVRDVVLDALIEREDTLFEPAEREELASEIVRRVNDQMYIPPLTIGTTMQYTVAQPWLGNARSYYTTHTGAWYAEAFPRYWIGRE